MKCMGIMVRRSFLILAAVASLTMASYAVTDDDGYIIVHKRQKGQLKGNTVGFENHDDLVAYQKLIESDDLSPDKLDQFLAEHTKTLRLDNLYVTVPGTEKPHRVHVSLTGKPYWIDGSKVSE